MKWRYNLIFLVFPLLFASFLDIKGKDVYSIHADSSKTALKSAKPYSARNNYTPIINPFESIPNIGTQAHKTAQSIQAIFNLVTDPFICLKCYNFFSGRHHHKSIRSQKTLLFPFHTFWWKQYRYSCYFMRWMCFAGYNNLCGC